MQSNVLFTDLHALFTPTTEESLSTDTTHSIHHSTGTPYEPSTQGRVERVNASLRLQLSHTYEIRNNVAAHEESHLGRVPNSKVCGTFRLREGGKMPQGMNEAPEEAMTALPPHTKPKSRLVALGNHDPDVTQTYSGTPEAGEMKMCMFSTIFNQGWKTAKTDVATVFLEKGVQRYIYRVVSQKN
eukprot:GHVR01093102.1.p1 GENE.GHVR01093102.1~~GHVR01093102.1.p1  ORF type:complete len:185 (+),score=18.85 GHVR01093102.1:29-583(+)